MDEIFKCKPPIMMQVIWSGEERTMVFDVEDGQITVRDLNEEEIAAIEKSELDIENARWREYWSSQ
jgi:hypothetical protein